MGSRGESGGQPVPSFYDDLAGSLEVAWALWSRGVADRRSPFHAPTCATIGLDGRPRARVVILRGCEPSVGMLRFHTDRRSDKFAEIGRDGRMALTGYDHGQKIQVRLEGRATLHTDDAHADAAWEGSRSFSRVCYGVQPGPGVGIANGGDFALPSADEDIAAGRANFCAVRLQAETLEWLYLAHDGHRRARFDLAGGAGGWLAP
jgi:pyridoxamine 5'-phosphate oxidase